jgi:branched-chain amino acid transport system substrate-binding protein
LSDFFVFLVAFAPIIDSFGAASYRGRTSDHSSRGRSTIQCRAWSGASSTDVSAQVLQLKEKNPDVVIFISYTADSILYVKTMKNLNYLPLMVVGDDSGFSDPTFIPAVDGIAQGAMNRSA